MKKLTTTLFGFFLANLATAQDMPLSQVLIPGEDWQLVSNHNGFTDAPTADGEGNFYFSDMRSDQGLLKVAPPGKVHLYLEGATGISGMKFGDVACSDHFKE